TPSACADGPRVPRRSHAPDLQPEQLALAERLPAALAIDREGRREGGVAARATVEQRAGAGRAHRRHLVLVRLEPPQRAAAGEAERSPIAEHLSPLLTKPVGRLTHVA